jgi:hypothetical protein
MICTVGSFCALSEFDESINFLLYEFDELDESVTSHAANDQSPVPSPSLWEGWGGLPYILYNSPAFIFRNLFTEK